MNIALCDDDPVQLEAAAETLSVFAEERGVKFSLSLFTSIDDLLASEALGSFDVVFMDIEFGSKPTGIGAVERINALAPRCQVAYLTNYIQYSVDVYHTDHVWFVVKSQFQRRLPEIFDKLARIRDAQRAFVVVETKDGSIANINCQDILCLERCKRITRLETTSATFETPEKLADIFERLPKSCFAYSHSSYIVNMSRVTLVHATELVFDNGLTVPVSRRYAKRFRENYFEWAEQWTV